MAREKLPIDDFKDLIVGSIKNNRETILIAETGAGKTIRVPQFLLEETNADIIITQPRQIAARSVAKRVAEEMECSFGGLVGFRHARERNDSDETRCLFITDGLQMVRELTKQKETLKDGMILIVDEVHEWNQNIETLIAWAKKSIAEGLDIKLVLMTATINHEGLADFFPNASIIEVPGRTFPVIGSPKHQEGIAQKDEKEMVPEIKRLVAAGLNTLVFLPGKGEIEELMNELVNEKLDAVLLPLHGDLTSDEQGRVFNTYARTKVILATNVAQTSLTIPDIDAVVDSGFERRTEISNGVEGLKIGIISQADCIQRAGRAGRTKPGEYVLCNNVPYADFEKHPTPEIQRTLLDQMVLRLGAAGLDATTLPFYHQPDKELLIGAKKTLVAIEAFDVHGNITKLGREINRFPTSVKAARMILEAIKRKCLTPVLTIAAVLTTQYRTLRRRKRKDESFLEFKSWEELFPRDAKYASDLFIERELFGKAQEMKDWKERAQRGIDPKGYANAVEIRKQLADAVYHLKYQDPNYNDNRDNEEAILKCIAAGMVDHLYQHSYHTNYVNDDQRRLSKDSILHRLPEYPAWIVGEPRNISSRSTQGGTHEMLIVINATVVKPEWFKELAPHLIEEREETDWLYFKDAMITSKITLFNGKEISRETSPAKWSEEYFEIFLDKITSQYTGNDVINSLYRMNSEKIDSFYENDELNFSYPKHDLIKSHYRNTILKYAADKKILSFKGLEGLLGSVIPLDEMVISESMAVAIATTE